MNKYYIEDREVSVVEKIQHKLKQLKECSDMLEDINDKIAWADDFSLYSSIREALDPIYTAADQAKDEIDEEITEIEDELEKLIERRAECEEEIQRDFEQAIQHLL